MPYPRKKFRASMRIHSHPSGARVHVRWGSDLEEGLNEFFHEQLKDRGFEIVSCKNNVLIVKRDKDKHSYEFRAYAEVAK